MKKSTFGEKLSYRFDELMSKGTVAIIGVLFLVTTLVVLVAGFLAYLFQGGAGLTYLSATWHGLMTVVDGGNLGGEEGTIGYMLLMVVTTVCGLFITSILIGIINNAFESKLESLRKGKSKIIEDNHTVIIGWNEHVFSVISEIIDANENQKDPAIVVLSETDKQEMEDEIAARITNFKNTRVICRSGVPTELHSLKTVNISTCRSIIVTTSNDFSTIKAILAIKKAFSDFGNENNAYITAILNEESNVEAAHVAGGDSVETIFFEDTLSRIIAQTCRQPGLTNVYRELFDFDGDEIYFEKHKDTQGTTYGDILNMFHTSSVMGLVREGETFINPPMDTRIGGNDEIILLASDDGVSKVEIPISIDTSKICKKAVIPDAKPEALLIFGYNKMLDNILIEIDNYIAKDSKVVIASDSKAAEEFALSVASLVKNINIQVSHCDITSRKQIEKFVSAEPDYIVVLSDLDVPAEEADAKTLLLLLHLKDFGDKNKKRFKIVSEMQDSENQKLAACTNVNDFVIGSNLISLMLAQVSENRGLNRVFTTLLEPEGSEIYMKPAGNYIKCNEEVQYATIVEAARLRSETAIGYKTVAKSYDDVDSIITNPRKDSIVTLSEADYVIVLAED